MFKKIFVISILSIMYSTVFASSKPANMSNGKMETAIAAIPMYTIKAKSRTPEENLRHQKFCAKQGGVDITDENDTQIAAGTIDAIFCKITGKENVQKYIKDNSNNSVGNIDSVAALSNKEIEAWNFFANAPRGTLSPGTYYARGEGHFRGLTGQAYIGINIMNQPCAASNSAWVNGGNAVLTATTICQEHNRGVTRIAQAQACFQGRCVFDTGQIHFR